MIQCILNTLSTILLIQGTSGNTLVVLQTIRAVTRSVTLIIKNTLSLSVSQYLKIKPANTVHELIKVFHLDLIRTKRNEEKVLKRIICVVINQIN